jgi:hypothetical protein
VDPNHRLALGKPRPRRLSVWGHSCTTLAAVLTEIYLLVCNVLSRNVGVTRAPRWLAQPTTHHPRHTRAWGRGGGWRGVIWVVAWLRLRRGMGVSSRWRRRRDAPRTGDGAARGAGAASVAPCILLFLTGISLCDVCSC